MQDDPYTFPEAREPGEGETVYTVPIDWYCVTKDSLVHCCL